MRPRHKNWLLLGCFSIVWTASLAQGENHNDSLSPITHIPVIEDSASVSVTADSVAVKRSFFKKLWTTSMMPTRRRRTKSLTSV